MFFSPFKQHDNIDLKFTRHFIYIYNIYQYFINMKCSLAITPLFCVCFRPKYSLLGQVADTDIYKPVEDYDKVNSKNLLT